MKVPIYLESAETLSYYRKPNFLDQKLNETVLISVFLYMQLIFTYAVCNDNIRREMDASACILVSDTQLFVLFLLTQDFFFFLMRENVFCN